MVLSDTIGFVGCVVACSWISLINAGTMSNLIFAATVTFAFGAAIARYLGFYHSIVRYLGMNLLLASAQVAIGSGIAFAILTWWTGMATQPLKVVVIYASFCGLYLVGSRYTAQYFLIRNSPEKTNVIIYGAGESGARVVQAMDGNSSLTPVAFVDDEAKIQGKQLNGLPVYAREKLEKLIERHQVSRVLLAMPSASRRSRRKIVASLEGLPVHVQTVPDFNDLISGKATFDDIRDVDVEDLLTRAPVAPVASLLQATLLGKSVLVTGAGGSIGSELCRQILHARPKRIVLFELSEVALYTIDKELRALAAKFELDVHIVPLLGSVQHQHRVQEVMHRFDIETVYHAAAYKHVPMVEQNIIEGACNNVLGTLYAANAAISTGVETFVLVSTDKAVSPTNVMGATKRLAEQVLQALQPTADKTRFSMVRFGNVLESSGSVVPLFRDQIRQGGPVTVTHPLIIRYFMTIPEAAQLVIQAGAMAEGGDVFVLDMGEPVKIVDLATRMIHLAGLTVRDSDTPDGDIDIEFTGLRPAEKLYEELLLGENVSGTKHPRIMRAEEHFMPYEELMPLMTAVEEAAQHLDRSRMREILQAAVTEYEVSAVKDLLWDTSDSVEPGTVSDGPANLH
jgi:FlaA1/EpsC-like NDP-sugar epimerase